MKEIKAHNSRTVWGGPRKRGKRTSNANANNIDLLFRCAGDPRWKETFLEWIQTPHPPQPHPPVTPKTFAAHLKGQSMPLLVLTAPSSIVHSERIKNNTNFERQQKNFQKITELLHSESAYTPYMHISVGLDCIILEWNLDSKTQPNFPLKWAVIIHSRATDTSVINIHFVRFFIFAASQWFLVTDTITLSSHRPHAWEPS